jgi:hypothetical protein
MRLDRTRVSADVGFRCYRPPGHSSPFPFADPLRSFHNLATRRVRGSPMGGGQHLLRRAPGAPGYEPNAKVRMRVPESARNFVESLNPGRVNIAVLPAGSSHEPIYPTAAWWRPALSVLGDEFPGAHFFLTGKSRPDDSPQPISTFRILRLPAQHFPQQRVRHHPFLNNRNANCCVQCGSRPLHEPEGASY